MPLANAYPDSDAAGPGEPRYPLHAFICEACLLVQLPAVVPPEAMFSDYAYFSSYSDSWVEHTRAFARRAVEELSLDSDSLVVEIASNDGCLLSQFAEQGIPVLGIEPAANVARVANERGIRTMVEFFGLEAAEALAARGSLADLVVANNVIAHVPDLNGFVAGIKRILKPGGTVTVEFPHILNLLDHVQFDSIYHEHYSYFSLGSLEPVFRRNGLRVFRVDRLHTHGGSLRVFACHDDDQRRETEGYEALVRLEAERGLDKIATYRGFAPRVEGCRTSLIEFISDARSRDRIVAGYGAAAKGSTLLNYCGLSRDDIAFVVDRNPYKQGRYVPGCGVPIVKPEYVLIEPRPSYMVLFAWNWADEIMGQMAFVRDWNCQFVVPIPRTRVVG